MTTQGVKRKLTAIFSADVKGYSRLMREDEVGTIRTLTAYREVMSRLIEQHRGRVVDSPGDNLLAEFASVVDAVECAVEVQREFKARNAELPENRRMEFRIGVNLGDVIEEGDRIYGDGVNIAARIEGLAEGGGICISGSSYEQVKNKLALGFEYLGEQTVKNIVEPVRVYRAQIEPAAKKAEKRVGLRWQWAVLALVIMGAGAVVIWNFFLRPVRPTVEPASIEKMAFPLPDKPSIAVLPFINMSGDPEQEYFSDGITEDLITDLSQISGLFVISRNSAFTYKGKPVKTKQVAEELGVRYVLEGSVRKADNRVRINAQLIDATTGGHLWAKRYDGDMSDVFALQDKITQKIVAALAVKLTSGEKKHVARRETDNIAAYDAFLQGWSHLRLLTSEDFAKALSYFEKAVELDPNYGRAYAALAKTHLVAYNLGFFGSLRATPSEARLRAREYLKMAMKNPTSLAYQIASEMSLWQRLHEEAIGEAEQAIALDPNDPSAHINMANVLIMAGRPQEAVDFLKRAVRLDPHYLPGVYLSYLGMAKFAMGQLEEAVLLSERALKHNPELLWLTAAYTIAAYAHLGRNQEARATFEEFKKTLMTWPSFGGLMWMLPFKDPEVADRLADGLLKAGLHGHPSDYFIVSEEDRLTGDEIRALVFGRTISGRSPLAPTQWSVTTPRMGKLPVGEADGRVVVAIAGSRGICSATSGKRKRL